MPKNESLPRLTVLLASEAPVGVVLRRGPSKRVRVVIWNRAKDRFTPGPSFRGRIFADCSDVSPDGRHFLYFAMGAAAWAIPETGGTWTAISKLPFLTADALWGQGDTRGGGGMFLSDRSYWLDADTNTFLIRDDSGLRRELYQARRPYQSRMERDGWTNRVRGTDVIFEKQLPKRWILRKLGLKGGYELEPPGDRALSFPAWEWAEWDRHRLVWAEQGRLQTAPLSPQRLGTVHILQDFTR